MIAKPLISNKNTKSQGATLLGPGDFPLGSPQSRAAARLRLQLVGVGGDPAVDCICFPEDEPPSFGFPVEMEIASKVLCPVHGLKFAYLSHLYVAKRFREQLWTDLQTHHSEQYRKAWFARFPPEVWPAAEEETGNGAIFLKLKDGSRLLACEPASRLSYTGNERNQLVSKN
jgi:hypothetical protein